MIADDRACVGCGNAVVNETLAGHFGAGALSGPLQCETCLARADAEELRRYRRKQFEATREKVRQSVQAEVEAILAEFDHLEALRALAGSALKSLQRDPAEPEAQRALLLLSREFARDVTVLLHGFSRRRW